MSGHADEKNWTKWFEDFAAEHPQQWEMSDEQAFSGFMMQPSRDDGRSAGRVDVENQRRAIHSVLDAAKASERALQQEITDLLALKNPTPKDEEDYPFYCMLSVYQSAAVSMATAGMRAGLLEAILKTFLRNLGKDHGNALRQVKTDYSRWSDFQKDKDAFNPSKKSKKENNKSTYDVAFDLLENIGLEIQKEDRDLFGLLYNYRNKMLHIGMEWPAEEIDKFRKELNKYTNDYFSTATHGEEIWIFYVGDPFLAALDEATTRLCRAMGAFVNQLWRS